MTGTCCASSTSTTVYQVFSTVHSEEGSVAYLALISENWDSQTLKKLKFYFSLHLVSPHVGDRHSSQMALCFLKLKALLWHKLDPSRGQNTAVAEQWNPSWKVKIQAWCCPEQKFHCAQSKMSACPLLLWTKKWLPKPWWSDENWDYLTDFQPVTVGVYHWTESPSYYQCMCIMHVQGKRTLATAPLARTNHGCWKTSSLGVHGDKKHLRTTGGVRLQLYFGKSYECAGPLCRFSQCTSCRFTSSKTTSSCPS